MFVISAINTTVILRFIASAQTELYIITVLYKHTCLVLSVQVVIPE